MPLLTAMPATYTLASTLAALSVWILAPLPARGAAPSDAGAPRLPPADSHASATVLQESRTLPVVARADLAIAGGSAAGAAAALRAAERGESVVLIEESCALADAGLQRRVARERRIRVYLFSLATDVVRHDGRVCGVTMANHSGRQVVLARRVLDATEDARLARVAGRRTSAPRDAGAGTLAPIELATDGPAPALDPAQEGASPSPDRQGCIRELLAGPDPLVGYPTLREEARALPVAASCDVLVAGGGTSGAYAAIAAAREGARVILVEILAELGGTSTHRVTGYYWGVPWRSRLVREIDRQIATRQQAGPGSLEKVSFSGEAKKAALRQAALDAGVDIRFRTLVAGALVERGRVTGAVVEGAGGRRVIRAGVVIDATGLGAVAAAAGAAFDKGRARDGFLHEIEHGLLRDPTNAEDLSVAYLNRRARAPGLAIRESRRIAGDQTAAFDDAIHGRVQPDVVIRWRSNYDTHFPNSANQDARAQDWTAILGQWRRPLLGCIPYGALLPRSIDGVIVVGKSYSATHDALIGARMQRDLQHLGEAAGVAAALCSRDAIAPRALPVHRLQKTLVARGVLRAEDVDLAHSRPMPVSPEATAAAVARLGTPDALDAMVTLYRARADATAGPLREVLATGKQSAREEAALLLGLAGDKSVADTLIGFVQVRNPRTFEYRLERASSRSSVPLFCSAMILLGRMREPRALAPIVDLIDGPDPCAPDVASFAAVALEQIGDRAAIPTLRPLLAWPRPETARDENVESDALWGVRTNAARALAALGDRSGAPALIELLSSEQSLVRDYAQRLLEKLSGRKLGKDQARWEAWWHSASAGR